jgi:membrane protein implicated in regulation of membrane protease activity
MTTASYKGPGFFTLLGLLFIGLKLGKVITWSWWWVLAPFWGAAVLFVVITLITFSVAVNMVNKMAGEKKNGRKNKN